MLLLHLSRSLRRAPYTAAAAILTLALTLGAGASIFALVEAVLLAPLPFANPEALVTLREAPLDAPHAPPRAVAYATFDAWRDRAKTLAALEAFDGTNLTLTHAGSSERISATDVTPGFLTLLGIIPALGRVFSPGDVAQRVIIVSNRFWRSRLASDRSVVGRQILLDGQSYTVIGVLPAGFVFALDVGDIWRPMPFTAARAASQGYRVRVLARLAGRVAAAHLADALNEVSHASPKPARVIATSVTAAIAGDKTPALGMLAGAYFDVMRIPVRAGRPFTFDDDSEAPSRVVISQSLADTDPADGPPIGRTLLLGRAARSMEVVGVVGDVKHRSLDERALQTVYLSAWQVPSSSSIVVIRSGRPQADAVAAVREEVARLDGNIPVYRVRSMTDVVAASPGVPARRMVTAAFSVFALLALVLSAIGLFGLAAHDVACRRTELALRIALGARPARIVQATLGRTALMIGVGLALGSVLSMWTVRALGTAAFAGGGPDAPSLAVATAVLLATGAAAALPAALRAARIDPLNGLRRE